MSTKQPTSVTLTLLRDEADEVRAILRRHMRNGIWFTERRNWWLWVRFTITGAPEAMSGVRRDLVRWGDDKFIENAW